MNLTAALVIASLLSVAATACGSSSADSTERTIAQGSVRAAESTKPADVVGTWAFDLDASDVATPIHEECAKEADAEACWSAIATQAKREMVRFENDPTGHAIWTSFALEDKTEIVFVRVPVDLVVDGPGHVLAKIAGAPTGTKATHFEKTHTSQLRIEVIDANTIAMADPKKGRLVYVRN